MEHPPPHTGEGPVSKGFSTANCRAWLSLPSAPSPLRQPLKNKQKSLESRIRPIPPSSPLPTGSTAAQLLNLNAPLGPLPSSRPVARVTFLPGKNQAERVKCNECLSKKSMWSDAKAGGLGRWGVLLKNFCWCQCTDLLHKPFPPASPQNTHHCLPGIVLYMPQTLRW